MIVDYVIVVIVLIFKNIYHRSIGNPQLLLVFSLRLESIVIPQRKVDLLFNTLPTLYK